MNTFILWLLIGLGIGIPVFFIGLWVVRKIKNVLERREVKKMIKQNKFLMPIDIKDLGEEQAKAWGLSKEQLEKNARELEQLNQKIFKKQPEDKGI